MTGALADLGIPESFPRPQTLVPPTFSTWSIFPLTLWRDTSSISMASSLTVLSTCIVASRSLRCLTMSARRRFEPGAMIHDVEDSKRMSMSSREHLDVSGTGLGQD